MNEVRALLFEIDVDVAAQLLVSDVFLVAV